MATALSIGKLATAAGVNIETIRYYQRRGLLAVPAKPEGGQRRYTLAELKRVRFIKRAQALGFSLIEIEGLLGLDSRNACAETQALALRKLRLIEQKIADLAKIHQALSGLAQQCASDAAACPIIDLLAED